MSCSCNHKKTDLLIIGGGPGGYTAAFLAADRGLNVTLISTDAQLGGVCLHRGCIPSKALLHAAQLITQTKDASAIGITFTDPQIDLTKLHEWKNALIAKIASGLEFLRAKRGVTFIQGNAFFMSETLAIAQTAQGEEAIEFKKAIIATGSSSVGLPNMPLSSRIMDSSAALDLSNIPKSLIVIGGGYIGLELGSVYAALGSHVSVVEMTDSLLPGIDHDLTKILTRKLKKNFTNIFLKTKVTNVNEIHDQLSITIEDTKGTTQHLSDKILVAIGRKPNTASLNLGRAGITTDEKGFIKVSEQRETTNPRVWAIGDVTGNPMLAHKASAEARVAIDAICGGTLTFHPMAIPAVIFTDPQIAYCGLTEQQATEQGLDFEIAKFPWNACGKALASQAADGFTKIISDKSTGHILGVGIVGAEAGELIAEAALAIEKNLTIDEIAHTIHAHPTLSENLKEAAEMILGECAHIYRDM